MSEEPAHDERARFQRADRLFDDALDLEPSRRDAFILDKAGADLELLSDVRALLRAHERSADFMATPVASDPLLQRLQQVVGQPYRVRKRIASGGMASVYLADDVRHDRLVAIKVFQAAPDGPGTALRGGDRFSGEIRLMARLQHPHLLPLFDSGQGDGLAYYVMPFVDGETLRQRITRESPLPVDEALRIMHAVAGAIEHAHAAGVVHRDLKPENVLLRDGEPLVADFGIALADDGTGARVTRSGVIIGTPQYMSPEQATGEHDVDHRTDVYSLGAMLYELLVGDPPHVASSAQGILAKVRAERPTPVHLLRDTVSPALSLVIDRALAKRPADRYQSVAEFDQALRAARAGAARAGAARAGAVGEGAAGDEVAQTGSPSAARSRTPRWHVWAIAASLLGLVVLGGVWRFGRARETTGELAATSRFVVPPLPDAAIGRAPALTPDGLTLVYPGSAATGRRLFVRRVSELQARPLPNTEGALIAFVSPNGKSIGFIGSDDKLRRVSIDGGPVTVMAGVFRYADAVWADDRHVVVEGLGQYGLSYVASDGGALRPFTSLDTLRRDSGHMLPFVLPDHRTVLFTITRDVSGPFSDVGELAAARLDTASAAPAPITHLGVKGRRVIGFVDGWLLFTATSADALLAIRFDAQSLRVSGKPVRVLEHAGGGLEAATLASNGTLLYTRIIRRNAPVLVDSTGAAKPMLNDVTGNFMNPRLSPDGNRLLMQSTSPTGNDVVMYDLATRTPARLTSNGSAVGPAWEPDGRQLVFFSTAGARTAIWRGPIDGSAPAREVLASEGVFGVSVSRDGARLIFQRIVDGKWSVWHARAAGDSAPVPFVVESYDAFMPSLSPNGRWLAYAANQSGRYEIYVRPFPGPGTAVQVSQDGGAEPAWSADGTRLFFRGERRMYVATVQDRAGLTVLDRRTLFTDAFDGDMPMPHRNYDISRDGRHFVMIAAAPGVAPETIVVLNWLKEFRARLAAGAAAP